VKVVADSHAIVWYLQGLERLSASAATALGKVESHHGLVVSVATLIDLWYVTQTTRAVSADQLAELRSRVTASRAVTLQPVTEEIIDAFTSIPRASLADPWDRLIVATALALKIPLVSRGHRHWEVRAGVHHLVTAAPRQTGHGWRPTDANAQAGAQMSEAASAIPEH
jgi:PIN domain nuclease of toxin-antitoxin system